MFSAFFVPFDPDDLFIYLTGQFLVLSNNRNYQEFVECCSGRLDISPAPS